MILKRFAGVIPALAVAALLSGCTAEVEDEGDLPNIEVTDQGEMPEVDVDPANVDISTDTQQVVVPDVDVNATEGNDP